MVAAATRPKSYIFTDVTEEHLEYGEDLWQDEAGEIHSGTRPGSQQDIIIRQLEKMAKKYLNNDAIKLLEMVRGEQKPTKHRKNKNST
jgi:hypothetical protein